MVKYSSLMKKSFSTYTKNPIIIVPYLIMGILSFIIYYIQNFGMLSGDFSTILFQATTLLLFIILECGAMGVIVKTAVHGKGDLNNFRKAVENKWIDYLGGTLMVLAILSLGIFPIIIYQTLEITFLNILSIVGIAYISISIFLFLFYKQAVMIDDKSPLGCLEKSASIVKESILEVLIYILLLSFLSILISLPIIFPAFLSIFKPELQILVPFGLLITLILSPIASLYSVFFYLEVK